MDSEGRLSRPLIDTRPRARRGRDEVPVSRRDRINETRRRLTRMRRFLSRHGWILPSVKFGAAALVVGAISGAIVATNFVNTVGREASGIMAAAGFTVRTITISGYRAQSKQSIANALGVPEGTVLWQADLVAARERILALPWVKTVTLARVAPDTLTIDIIERRPVALWQTDQKFLALDDGGEIITEIVPKDHRGLFHIVGVSAGGAAPKLFSELYKHPHLAPQIRAAVYVGERRWNLHFDNHVVAELPDGEIATALQLLHDLIEDEGLFDRAFDVIDLRDLKQPRLRGVDRTAMSPEPGDRI